MAMDLSTHRQQGDLNNNLACSAVVDLSLPRKEKKEDVENRSDFADLSKLVKEDKDKDAKLVVGEQSSVSSCSRALRVTRYYSADHQNTKQEDEKEKIKRIPSSKKFLRITLEFFFPFLRA